MVPRRETEEQRETTPCTTRIGLRWEQRKIGGQKEGKRRTVRETGRGRGRGRETIPQGVRCTHLRFPHLPDL